MKSTSFHLRYLIPVILISLCLVCLCTFTAISLFSQQESVNRILRENVESRRAAVELEECLIDLIALEDEKIETVAVLHKRVAGHLVTMQKVSDQKEERELLELMQLNYKEYLQQWNNLPPLGQPGHETERKLVTRYLEDSVLKPCQQFEQYNTGRIEFSAENHERMLRRLAWGMAGIGGLGAVAGIVLGFGIARELSRSFKRLQVQLRDVAGKMQPNAAEIVITEQGDFSDLHAEVDRLTGRVEHMVEELRQREHEVLRAEQLAALGQLAAGVAHEIRNPLTSMKLIVQASQELNDPLGPDDMHIMVTEIRRMEHSLQTFLDFARPPRLERKPTEILQTIQSVFDLIRPRAEKQKVALELVQKGEIRLNADATQLRQVLLNLTLNALDMMPRGGSLRVLANDTVNGAEIEVADSGPGISREILPRLFQPFASGKDTGLGLGLVISKRIIEGHGGRIGAANRVEGGASFFLTLPR